MFCWRTKIVLTGAHVSVGAPSEPSSLEDATDPRVSVPMFEGSLPKAARALPVRPNPTEVVSTKSPELGKDFKL